jgi:hypothetical protein
LPRARLHCAPVNKWLLPAVLAVLVLAVIIGAIVR